MSVQQLPAAASISATSEICSLSRSRFYDLIQSGVFPEPVRHPSSNRPIYSRDLIEKCLEIRRTGIDYSKQPVLFNRKLNKLRKPTQGRNSVSNSTEYSEVTDALKSLGLTTTHEAVAQAVGDLYSDGDWKEADQGEVIRKVFLQLQSTGASK